jgi:hypothetical protein
MLPCNAHPIQVNPAEERLALWLNCRLSGAPLAPPCCADRLGSVFNKAAVLEVITPSLSLSCEKQWVVHVELR